jgi:uncharacterized protein DUF4838/glycosyl hydrolase family 20
MRELMVIGLMAVVGVAELSAETLDVQKMAGWNLVVAEDASASERYAAAEFAALFEQATGIKLATVTKAEGAKGNVFIGPSEEMAGSKVGFKVDDLGEEGLRFHISADNVALAGGRPRGTLYGVYEFFERYLGVRFLTHDHTHIPAAAKEAKIPCAQYEYVPPFSFRWSYYRENALQGAFAARLRVNTVTGDENLGGKTRQSLINHSFYRWCPVAKYGKEHPEYFALVDGQRKLDVGGGGPELCVTNPEVIEVVAKAVIAALDSDPKQRNISVSQNDNAEYCRCPRCEKVNEREGTPMGSNLAFVNGVAERVEKKHPNVKIGTLAYWYTRQTPKTIRPRRNVQIQLCSIECCTLHALNDPKCEKNRAFCRDMNGWREMCEDIWVWNYNTNFHMYDLPFPNLRSIGANVDYFHDSNVKGLFMQANGNGTSGEMSDLRNYVIARCLWRPGQESWALAEEFCRLHYGPAAGPIVEYLTMLHDNAEASGCHPGCFPSAGDVGLTPEVARKALGYFDRALALADDTVRARVEKASICAYKAMIEAGGRMEYADGACRMTLADEDQKIVDRYIALCQQYQMTMASERGSAAEYFEKIKRAAQGVPAVRLENDVWRVTLVPEDNARVVEMFHKPTERHLMAAMGRYNYGMRFWRGTFVELGMQGYDHNRPAPFKAEADGRSVRLTKVLADGSTIERTIGLEAGGSDRISCATRITHQGAEPKTYQVRVHPEFDIATDTNESAVVAAYVRNGKWLQINQDWELDHGPKSELMREARGGRFALYNHEAGFGVLASYDADEMAYPRLWWKPDWLTANLELVTPAAVLNKGESLYYRYSYEYLSKPPK